MCYVCYISTRDHAERAEKSESMSKVVTLEYRVSELEEEFGDIFRETVAGLQQAETEAVTLQPLYDALGNQEM